MPSTTARALKANVSEFALLDQAVIELLEKDALSGEPLAKLLKNTPGASRPAITADPRASVLPLDRQMPADHAALAT